MALFRIISFIIVINQCASLISCIWNYRVCQDCRGTGFCQE